METTGTDGRSGRTKLDVNQVIAASCDGGVQSVAVTASSFDFARPLATKFVVYRSRSVIRSALLPWRGTC
jgi:hypothetical protein